MQFSFHIRPHPNMLYNANRCVNVRAKMMLEMIGSIKWFTVKNRIWVKIFSNKANPKCDEKWSGHTRQTTQP